MILQKDYRRPAPRIRFDVLVGSAVITQHLFQRRSHAISQLLLDQRYSSPVFDFGLGLGNNSHRQFLSIPAMGPQPFGRTFHQPRWTVVSILAIHEPVSPFMQQQMATVIGAGLFNHPNLIAKLKPIRKLRQLAWDKASLLELITAQHHERFDVPIGDVL